MQSRITAFLDTHVLKEEFSHTIVHGKNLFALADERKKYEKDLIAKEKEKLEVIPELSKEESIDTPDSTVSKKLQFS